MQPDRWFGAGPAEGADAGVRGFHNQTLVVLSIA
jgi:hypothetical protein